MEYIIAMTVSLLQPVISHDARN